MKAKPRISYERSAWWMGLVTLAASGWSSAASLTSTDAVARVQEWMQGNPLFRKFPREVAETSVFPESGGPGSLHVIKLQPMGYVLTNSDDTLPLVVGYSESSAISLVDDSQNALRAMLLRHVESTAAQLANPTQKPSVKTMSVTALGQDVWIGPLLETSWDQTNPYNLNCPADPAAYNGYDGRVPTGCVPTAFAQVMKFHRWPIHGTGNHSYTDGDGSITGTHSADFSDTYEWDSMTPTYTPWDVANPPGAAKTSIGELMYELGVAAEADYESSGTASSTQALGGMLGTHLYYGQTANQSQTSAIAAVEADLRAGLPSVVSVPGHAMVADGLMVSGGVTSYHLNYGWGGSNNGWYAANAVYIGPVDGAVTSIVPQLTPFPVQPTVSTNSGQTTQLQWYLPRKREHLAQQVQLYRRVTSAQNSWTNGGSSFGKASNHGWVIDGSNGRNGAACYAGPNGPKSVDLDESFIPTATSQLAFWRWAELGSNAFRVLVSTDNGQTFNQVYSLTNTYETSSWRQQTISLATYAGQSVKLRFELTFGSYYGSGGIWLDDLSVSNCAWRSWTAQGTPLALSAQRFARTATLWDGAADFTKFPKTSTSSYKDWTLATLGTGEQVFYKEAGGYGNHQYHLTSLNPITPVANTRLAIRMKTTLSSDSFRVLISTNRTSFSQVLGTVSGTSDWLDHTFNLTAWTGTPIYVRLEYLVGGYISGGGVWIDSISTEQVTNPELEQQPLHTCQFTPPAAGTYELAAAVIDSNQIEQPLSPPFTLTATGETLAAQGTPYSWLTTYGGVPAGSSSATFDAAELSDPYGKGIPLAQEYVLGTIPNQPNSRFATTVASLPGGGFQLQWPGMAGRSYRVLRSNSLTGATWTQQHSSACTTAGPMSWSDPSPPVGRAFYRLAVSLTP